MKREKCEVEGSRNMFTGCVRAGELEFERGQEKDAEAKCCRGRVVSGLIGSGRVGSGRMR